MGYARQLEQAVAGCARARARAYAQHEQVELHAVGRDRPPADEKVVLPPPLPLGEHRLRVEEAHLALVERGGELGVRRVRLEPARPRLAAEVAQAVADGLRRKVGEVGRALPQHLAHAHAAARPVVLVDEREDVLGDLVPILAAEQPPLALQLHGVHRVERVAELRVRALHRGSQRRGGQPLRGRLRLGRALLAHLVEPLVRALRQQAAQLEQPRHRRLELIVGVHRGRDGSERLAAGEGAGQEVVRVGGLGQSHQVGVRGRAQARLVSGLALDHHPATCATRAERVALVIPCGADRGAGRGAGPRGAARDSTRLLRSSRAACHPARGARTASGRCRPRSAAALQPLQPFCRCGERSQCY